MKKILLILVFSMFACKNEPREVITPGAEVIPDSVVTKYENPPKIKHFANERFKDVMALREPDGTYTIIGKAQVFEAAFGWVVEDGHNELAQGHQMTDAGAPEWGNFSFNVNVRKDEPNSTLHIILFESSAKDGSRQYELPVPLP